MEQNRCPGCMEIKTGGVVCEHCGYDERKKNEPHQLQIGTVLQDRFLIGRALGQGGFGITYLGWNRYLETKVAIKEYYPSVFVERHTAYSTAVACKTVRMEEAFTENRMRFLREAKTLAKLQSVPQIVSILDFFEVNNTAYIVMEYLQGNDLRHYVRKKGGCLSPTETFNIMRPVMAALVKIHEAGLVHRDISPDNIMLQHDGSVKLMDFGAVRSVNNAAVDKELTQATQAIVKHGFAPIEQYSERGSIGPWTDEYALCATMYYCMTGRVPENVHDRIIEGSDLNWDGIAGLTEKQKQILCKGTAIHAKDRHSNIRQLMDALFGQPSQTGGNAAPTQRETVKVAVTKREAKTQDAASAETDSEDLQETPRKSGAEKWKAIFLLDIAFLIGIILLITERWLPGLILLLVAAVSTLIWVPVIMRKESADDLERVGWQEVNDARCYFDEDGEMLTGWQLVDGNKYYFSRSGKMRAVVQTIDERDCYFDSNGEPLTGLQEFDDCKYYFEEDGKLVFGSRLVDGCLYYYGQDEKPLTGIWEIDDCDHYFDKAGKMVFSSQWEDKGLRYYDRNEKPLNGVWKIDGDRYKFEDGRLVE